MKKLKDKENLRNKPNNNLKKIQKEFNKMMKKCIKVMIHLIVLKRFVELIKDFEI